MTATVVYEAPGEVSVWFDANPAEIVVRWTRFGDHTTFRDSLDAQADLVEAGRARFIVVDVQAATGSPSARDHDYVNRFVYPRYRAGGLAAIVTVLPRDAHTRMGTQRWQQHGRAWGFAVYETATLDDAHDLLQDHHARMPV
ncbi:hypothetical protein [Kineosporia sp. R_H_3]|uniref:hypothetical protein n=1 Tax=Kineosporia sp. R_H_3 TaxID=1961848 RepID=UPI000B4B2E86|nr:hypothetical protein [Kineosporia sp. R_H_3]